MPQVKILGVPLNPGPFTVKEHVLITIMSNVSYQSAYAVRSSTMEATTSGRRLTYLSDRYHCCATRVLSTNIQFWIPVDAGHVNSIGIFGMYRSPVFLLTMLFVADWILHRRHRASLSSVTCVNDMA